MAGGVDDGKAHPDSEAASTIAGKVPIARARVQVIPITNTPSSKPAQQPSGFPKGLLLLDISTADRLCLFLGSYTRINRFSFKQFLLGNDCSTSTIPRKFSSVAGRAIALTSKSFLIFYSPRNIKRLHANQDGEHRDRSRKQPNCALVLAGVIFSLSACAWRPCRGPQALFRAQRVGLPICASAALDRRIDLGFGQ